MKRSLITLLLLATVAASGCAAETTTPSTMGVDGAPEVIRATFLTVTRQAATLAGYDATNEEWLTFAREVCAAGFETADDLDDFVAQRAGSGAEPRLEQMWSTATSAATTSFCPVG